MTENIKVVPPFSMLERCMSFSQDPRHSMFTVPHESILHGAY